MEERGRGVRSRARRSVALAWPVLWLAVSLLGGVAGLLARVHAEDAPAPAPGAEERALTGEEKHRHDAAVKALVETLKGEKNRESVRRHLGRLGAEGGRVSRDALIQFATGNKNQEFSREAFDALAKIGGKVALDFLCGKGALRSPDFLTQVSAAIALGSTKDPRAVAPLLEVASSPASKIEVVGAAVLAVARCGPGDAKVTDTVHTLARHGKDTIRANAVEALGHLLASSAFDRLKEVLTTEKNARVRAAAATGLGHTKRRDAVPLLESVLKTDAAFQVKDAVEAALKEILGG